MSLLYVGTLLYPTVTLILVPWKLPLCISQGNNEVIQQQPPHLDLDPSESCHIMIPLHPYPASHLRCSYLISSHYLTINSLPTTTYKAMCVSTSLYPMSHLTPRIPSLPLSSSHINREIGHQHEENNLQPSDRHTRYEHKNKLSRFGSGPYSTL